MLALKLLLRNWRSGQLYLISIALLVAVTVVSGIAIFVERLEGSLALQTAELLGADAVVVSPTLPDSEWQQQASRRNIEYVNFIRMQSMAYAQDEMSLISLQVVEPGYPLRGGLYVSDSVANTKLRGQLVKTIPNPGEVWASAELFLQLDLALGDNLEIGNANFVVSKVITDSPESFTRYPIVMMNFADLASAGVIIPGSNVNYRWLLASDDKAALSDFKLWLEDKLNPHQAISDAHSRSEWLQRTVTSSTNLLSFSAVIAVLLAGVAISIATRQFVEHHVAQVAVKKSFGASTKQIRQVYFGQLFILAITASLCGIGLGHVMQQAIVDYMAQFYQVPLAPASLLPYLYSFIAGISFLLFFALPPIWHLPTIPPIRVLRSDVAINATKPWVQGGLFSSLIFGLIALFSRDIWITIKVSGVLVLVTGLTILVSRLILILSKKCSANSTGAWRLGWANLYRRSQHNSLLIAVFAVTLMALFTLGLMRNAFWQEIKQYSQAKEVNFYLLNIRAEEKPQVEAFLSSLELEFDKVYPTIVGRVTKVNGNDPSEETSEFWVYQWDVWMTWFEQLPEQQALLEGVWWPELPEVMDENVIAVSVREDVMEGAGYQLGDVLTFSIGGQRQQAKITSVRPSLRGAGVSVVFVFQPEHMSHFSHVYNMGVNLPDQHKRAVYQFGREHPTILIDGLDTWIAKTEKILKQALDGALLILLLTLFCGCLVLFAAINSSIASRQQESGLLRAFGSSRGLILGSIWIEFITVGVMAGGIAIIAAEILFYALQRGFTDISFSLHPSYWLPAIILSALFIGILGVLACRKTTSTPPNQVLREVG